MSRLRYREISKHYLLIFACVAHIFITPKLPLNMSAEAEAEAEAEAVAVAVALHAASIPVDAIGNAASGFLFVRYTMDWKNPIQIFRWFATDIRQVVP